jgi:hypothetical protein
MAKAGGKPVTEEFIVFHQQDAHGVLQKNRSNPDYPRPP